MAATFRPYQPYVDTPRVSAFLARTYPPTDRYPNWPRARWEYMVYAIEGGVEERLAATGIWESEGQIVAAANVEGGPGEAYLQVDPGRAGLKPELLRYAEGALCAEESGRKRLAVVVNAFDAELEALVRAAGYVRDPDAPQAVARLAFAPGALAYALPDGFTLTDRRACHDLRAINRVLWRGFDHPGPPPEEHVAGRADVARAPLYRPELVVMAQAPGGDLAAYCGMWYEAETRAAYVEPVATDPDYRRRGLGRAVVLEAARRAQALGATRAIVGSDLAFYRAIGFEPLFAAYSWRKAW